jgi:hypothetical protein
MPMKAQNPQNTRLYAKKRIPTHPSPQQSETFFVFLFFSNTAIILEDHYFLRIIHPGSTRIVDLLLILDRCLDLTLALYELQCQSRGRMPGDMTMHEPHASFGFCQ